MKIFGCLFLGIILATSLAFGQQKSTCKLRFSPVFEQSYVQLGKTYYLNKNGDSITFETLKFYISGIQFLLNKKVAWVDTAGFYLCDAEKVNSLIIPLEIPEGLRYNEIQFYCGIDSISNTLGALGGALDPTNGMYWTWQNGYINAKLEGKSSFCKSKDNAFELHLGGFQFPFNALQEVHLQLTSKELILIKLQLDQFIRQINIAEKHHVMSPSIEAIDYSKVFSHSFRIVQ